MQNGPEFKSDSDSLQEKKSILGSSLASGGIAGAVEVLIDHPFWTLKTRYQDDRIPPKEKFTFNPSVLYRGWLPNMSSTIPVTAMQVGTVAAISTFRHDDHNPPTEMEKIAYNAVGGGFSATISGPTELIMTQQTPERGFFATMKHIYANEGLKGFGRGMAGTAIRDAKFTVGYGFAAPYMKERFSQLMSEGQASMAGGAVAGVAVGVLSQPWDTLKTAQQTGSPLPLWALAKEKLRKEGISGMYKGSVWRMSRVASAVMIMGEVNQRVSNYLKPKI
ncbi:MC/SLC25 family protein [Candidatus Berkiella cookevillensis]|uniref:MC/SLC25 family protein n=1 Tax=Candidatus Berkiella cookevillensis TaxID=437022 RepID=A0A0Q9YFD2_9GAMM|nr:MC/SLC25 family protein [Candidatus Berkiella cookevillensis]MCS5708819.1 MC/SLC25 family protein [Candidatus Berkiella cookevillensis]